MLLFLSKGYVKHMVRDAGAKKIEYREKVQGPGTIRAFTSLHELLHQSRTYGSTLTATKLLR